MQFAFASKLNSAELKALLPTFDKILACVKGVRPPTPKMKVDPVLVSRGRDIFEGRESNDRNCKCMRCHGSTESGRYDYPEMKVALSTIETDSTLADRFLDKESIKHHEKVIKAITKSPSDINVSPSNRGYIAPPLVSLFAKTGLLHNRSVPTVKQLLCTFPEKRASVWSKPIDSNVFNEEGLTQNPTGEVVTGQIRYDTKEKGFSNSGHNFCNLLKDDPTACDAVTEYLKTL